MTQHRITTTYPCGCGRQVTFKAIEEVPVEVYSAKCRICGRSWNVTRTTLSLRSRPGVERTDKLEWETN